MARTLIRFWAVLFSSLMLIVVLLFDIDLIPPAGDLRFSCPSRRELTRISEPGI